MKWHPNKAFPYPVLRSEGAPKDRDYVDREFQAMPEMQIASDKSICLRVDYALSEETILELIESGDAEYATEVHCQKTALRRLMQGNETAREMNFGRGELHERVEINSYVVCKSKIKGHTSPNFHQEFGGGTRKFDLIEGDVLALASPSTYYVSFEEGFKVGSIFRVVEKKEATKAVEISLADEVIQIALAPDDYDKFKQIQDSSEARVVQLSSIYLIALVEALRAMDENRDEHADKRWCQKIEHKLNTEDIELKEDKVLEIAQQLFALPISKLLANYSKTHSGGT